MFGYLTDPIDKALLGQTPTLMVPSRGSLPDLGIGRYRFLMGREGLHMEGRTKALHACVRLWESPRPLPYGSVEPFVRMKGGLIPAAMFQEIVREAQAASPNEWACLVVYDPDNRRYRLHKAEGADAGRGHIHYSTAGVDSECIVLDLHTHGMGKAFFSNTDDRDDTTGGIYIASVLGHCDDVARMEAVSRINVRGIYFDLPWHPWE